MHVKNHFQNSLKTAVLLFTNLSKKLIFLLFYSIRSFEKAICQTLTLLNQTYYENQTFLASSSFQNLCETILPFNNTQLNPNVFLQSVAWSKYL